MPLPPALLNRLKQRGIIGKIDDDEEIIAENYDVGGGGDRQQRFSAATTISRAPSFGAPGCPNKYNPYHLCTEFCSDRWGDGRPENRLDSNYTRRRERMLKKYPLPTFWKEIYDAGTGRYYYWNTETDEVCWLSPLHPKAKPGPAACRLAKIEWEKISKKPASSKRRRRASSGDEDSDLSAESDNEEEERRKPVRKARYLKPSKGDLDPMDPASYSDVPRGKWSSGLETSTDAKTGVDTTASGPLFQQRPYPAPGAVLRRNVDAGKKKHKK